MVVLNKIYTRTGDAGLTALGTGERVPKHAARITAYGTVDETNAVLGVARLHLTAEYAGVEAMLGRIQNDLFDLGADLTIPERDGEPAAKPARERAAGDGPAGQAARGRDRRAERGACSPCDRSCCRAARPPRRRCTWRAPSAAAPSAAWWSSPACPAKASARRR